MDISNLKKSRGLGFDIVKTSSFEISFDGHDNVKTLIPEAQISFNKDDSSMWFSMLETVDGDAFKFLKSAHKYPKTAKILMYSTSGKLALEIPVIITITNYSFGLGWDESNEDEVVHYNVTATLGYV